MRLSRIPGQRWFDQPRQPPREPDFMGGFVQRHGDLYQAHWRFPQVWHPQESGWRITQHTTQAVIYCPRCRGQHVDMGAWRGFVHTSHLCEFCGEVWQPAPFPTVGVPKPPTQVVEAPTLPVFMTWWPRLTHEQKKRLASAAIDRQRALPLKEG